MLNAVLMDCSITQSLVKKVWNKRSNDRITEFQQSLGLELTGHMICTSVRTSNADEKILAIAHRREQCHVPVPRTGNQTLKLEIAHIHRPDISQYTTGTSTPTTPDMMHIMTQ